MPAPLDEFPLHQTPLSMRHVGTSDRNFYDRCYFNAHDRTGERLPRHRTRHLSEPRRDRRVRRPCGAGDQQWAVRFSDALGDDRLHQRGRAATASRSSSRCTSCGSSATATSTASASTCTWEGSFPAVDEEPHHVMRTGARAILDALALRAGRHLERHAARRRRTTSRSTPTLARQPRPVVGHPSGRRGRAAGRSRRRAGSRASGGSTCRCASTTSRSS